MVSFALEQLYQENSSLRELVDKSLRPSGTYVLYQKQSGDRLLVNAWEVCARGLNDIIDVVAVDDFIYGEPRALEFHSGDADGDGVADARIFRPSSATWFTLNSGTNTVSVDRFGLEGDIPIDGDFDGDRRADIAVFRPTEGAWFIHRSSNDSTFVQSFGMAGDKPVAGDYDKDGKTDIAVWRPVNGNYLILRSSDDRTSFFGFPFGAAGDIPVQGGAQ